MGIYWREDSGNFWISYTANGKQRREKAGPTRKHAEILLGDRKREVANDRVGIDNYSKITFDEYSSDYLKWAKQHKRSWARDKRIVANLSSYFGTLQLSKITPKDVRSYQQRRLTGKLQFGTVKAKEATINREVACLRRMLNLAVRDGVIPESKIAGKIDMLKERGQRDRWLKPAEAHRLVDAAKEHIRGPIILGLHTGMRKSEILGLRWQEVDLDRGVINLPASRTKDADDREIPINAVAREALELAQVNRVDGSDLVFHKPDGSNLGLIRKAWLTACRDAEISDFRFHDLRHTFATWLVQAGVSLQVVGEILGHSSIYMTMRYAHLCSDQRVAAVQVAADTFKNKKTNIVRYHKSITAGSK